MAQGQQGSCHSLKVACRTSLQIALALCLLDHSWGNPIGLPSKCVKSKPWLTNWKNKSSVYYHDYLYFNSTSNVNRFDDSVPIGVCPFGHQSNCPWPMLCGTIRNNSTSADYFANFLSGGIYLMIAFHFVWLSCFQLNTRSFHVILNFIVNNILYVSVHAQINEQRPVESCTVGCGMPSGHVANAFVLLAWDYYWVFVLSRPKFMAERHQLQYRGWVLIAQRALVFVVCTVMLAPMPWARWRLRDHSTSQIFAGSTLGLLTFLFWQTCFWPVITRATKRDWWVWEVIQLHFMCREVHGYSLRQFWLEVTGLDQWVLKAEADGTVSESGASVSSVVTPRSPAVAAAV